MAITTLAQTVGVSGVEDIVVTEAELDTESGDYVREIQIIGADEVPMFVLRVSAADRTKIDITAPEQEF